MERTIIALEICLISSSRRSSASKRSLSFFASANEPTYTQHILVPTMNRSTALLRASMLCGAEEISLPKAVGNFGVIALSYHSSGKLIRRVVPFNDANYGRTLRCAEHFWGLRFLDINSKRFAWRDQRRQRHRCT